MDTTDIAAVSYTHLVYAVFAQKSRIRHSFPHFGAKYPKDKQTRSERRAMKHPFDRGILFPPEVENKRLTAGLPPEEFRPKTLVIPLKQGIGEACVPVVEPGQGVKAGELVGRPLKEGVPVHCGVSGTVSAVENRPTLEGEGLCVVVENDFAGVAASGLKREEGREGLIRLMQEAGLVLSLIHI